MKTLLAFIGVCVGMLMSAAAEDASPGGDSGSEIHWVGRMISDLPHLSPPATAVAEAVQAAAEGNTNAFYSHWDIAGSNKSNIDKLFADWSSNSKKYIYIIGGEALVVGKKPRTNQLFAISVIPAEKKDLDSPDPTNLSTLHVDVIYARVDSNRVALVSESPDDSIGKMLVQKSLAFVYRSHNHSQQAVIEEQRKFHEFALETMKKNGASSDLLSSTRANFQMDEAGVQINGWKGWTNQFPTVISDQPISFDKADAFNYSYQDATAAFHSYVHAGFVGDGAEMLKHADSSGLEFLRRMQVTETGKGPYDLPVMSHVTVLLTATTSFNGKKYTLVLSRAENSKSPQNGSVALQTMIFVEQNGMFLMTRDLRDSYFGRVCEKAGCPPGGLWKYAEFEKGMESSQFPKSFYDF
jgi:hypothetical protein